MLYVYSLISAALAPAMAGQLADQNSGIATEAPSHHDNQARPSNAWALHQKLFLRHVQVDPSAYKVQNNPRRRSLCALRILASALQQGTA
jgi:hypothetical protein